MSSNQKNLFSSSEDEDEDLNNGSTEPLDYSMHFRTEKEWHDRELMLNWARDVGRPLNMVLTIKKSWKTRVILACEKSGHSRAAKKKVILEEGQKEAPRKRQTNTKKSDCKFELSGLMQKNMAWKLKVICGFHNHDLPQNLEGHAFAGRMTEAELNDVKKWIDSGIPPKKILPMLKEKYPNNLTSRKQIYNVRKHLARKSMGETEKSSCQSDFSVARMVDEEAVYEPEETQRPFIHLGFNWGVENVDGFMFAFITKVIDVIEDGHCGYRALAELLGWGQAQWPQVRIELAKEMLANKDIYAAIHPQSTPIEELIRNVNFLLENCTSKHRLEMPIVGLAFATKYKVALVLLSWSDAYTCLPMIVVEPNSTPPTVVLAVAQVRDRNSFVPVWFREDAPLPPTPVEWRNCHHSSVDNWDEAFRSRIDEFQAYRIDYGRPPA